VGFEQATPNFDTWHEIGFAGPDSFNEPTILSPSQNQGRTNTFFSDGNPPLGVGSFATERKKKEPNFWGGESF